MQRVQLRQEISCLYILIYTLIYIPMAPLWQGIQLGFLLAILVGPLLVALIQASLEEGTRAGFLVALGIWVSDLLFVVAVYFGVNYVAEITAWTHFKLVVGLVGALVLLATGIMTLLTPPPPLVATLQCSTTKHKVRAPFTLWSKGFLINTVNPFTVFFWVSVMMGVVLEKDYGAGQATLLFGGILGVIVFTDSLKVVLAKRFRHRLQQKHVVLVRKIAGIALIAFAIILAGRVLI